MRVHPGSFIVAGVLFVAANAPASMLYVDVNGTNATPPYAGWSTAATNIQDAVDAASAGDLILVTNGLYQFGGRPASPGVLTNRVDVNKALTVQSVNGPAVTLIQGFQVDESATNAYLSVRCVYLTNNALLVGFTLTNGCTGGGTGADHNDSLGAGVSAKPMRWCQIVSSPPTIRLMRAEVHIRGISIIVHSLVTRLLWMEVEQTTAL